MKEELLKIVCTEYRKMTGLDMVDINASLPGRHIDFLKERLTVNYGFKIMKGCSMNTINDFVKAIQAAYDFFEDLAKQTTEAAKKALLCATPFLLLCLVFGFMLAKINKGGKNAVSFVSAGYSAKYRNPAAVRGLFGFGTGYY